MKKSRNDCLFEPFDNHSSILGLARYNTSAKVRCSDSACNGVRESVNKLAASAASLDYVKFQAVIKSAASAASLAEAALAADLITAFFVDFWPR